MAALRLGSLCRWALRPAVAIATRREISVTPMATKAMGMADPLEHAVGMEKKEQLAILSGNDDPFEMKLKKQGEGTRNNPDLVPSIFNKRIVGHICEEDQDHITWFYLFKDHPKRCQCGHWFKLVESEPL